jgi:hypothetical protein
MADAKAPEWIMWEPARWLVGTAELDAMTEFVFFRLCMIAYESGDPIVTGSDRRNAVRCKVTPEVFASSLSLLVELEKVERTEDGGILVFSAARRLDDAASRIEGRQRGAKIARRRGMLKQEGRSSEEIDLIIRDEFADNQPEKTTHNRQNKQDRQDKTHNAGAGAQDLLGNLALPSKADLAEAAVSMWNDLASKHGLAKVQAVTARRKSALAARLKECGGLEGWGVALEKVEQSPFLLGQKTDFRADFDFVLQQKSFTKLMEGAYAGGAGPAPRSSAAMDHLRRMASDD